MMTTDIQAALARLREAFAAERYDLTLEREEATDAALDELERLLAAPPPPTKHDEVLTLGRLESLLLRAELTENSPSAGALLEAVQRELR